MPIKVEKLEKMSRYQGESGLLEYLKENEGEAYYISELSDILLVPRERIWEIKKKLVKRGILKQKKVGRKCYLYYNDGVK